MDMEKVGKWCAVAALLVLIVGFVPIPSIGPSKSLSERQAFMKECQDDGLKHYQCVSLWNGAGLPVFRSRDMLPLN
jgi:hypothetical protein